MINNKKIKKRVEAFKKQYKRFRNCIVRNKNF